MITQSGSQIEKRLQSLEKHLKQENPVLLRVVQSFRDLDRIAYRMGLLHRDESYATGVPWWPLVSVLGTFSSGKSTFINSYLGVKLQRTGNQAVDDKFTVICYSKEERIHTLPGLALDADPRFPFYQISREIDEVMQGEGRRIDSYLQLKTCPTERLKGKIIIDSPGFDADAQRTSILRIVDHIINLSDLVLVFFDARHPEPGAMRDTLEHLVANTINRHDSNKFLFVLNQVDCTAKEDNLEEVVAAWQRALAQAGLTAGRFFQIYDPDAAHTIEDDATRVRFEVKREEDLRELIDRIQHVEIERIYRIIGVLEHSARAIAEELVPMLSSLIARWGKLVLISDAIVFGLLAVLGLLGWFSTELTLPAPEELNWLHGAIAVVGLGGMLYLHTMIRKLAARWVARSIPKEAPDLERQAMLQKGFARNTVYWRSIFSRVPAGWGLFAERRLTQTMREAATYIQDLNDQFTNPSGKPGAKNPKLHLDIG